MFYLGSTMIATLSESNRIAEIDKKIDVDISDASFENHLFVRLVAKKRVFKNVDFKYAIFDACYLRDCTFDSCDFTGVRFVGTNLHGSSFPGCKFDYATFERTNIESDVLDTSCPGWENLKMRFARALRMNYQQMGDTSSANKAIGVELEATEVHLYKAWHSGEAYYRKKYPGWKRIGLFFEWLGFKILDWIWGNGERPWKLVWAVLVFFLLMSLTEIAFFQDPQHPISLTRAFIEAPQVFLGTRSPAHYPQWYLTVVVFVRLVAFAFFMSIIIKRFNRR